MHCSSSSCCSLIHSSSSSTAGWSSRQLSRRVPAEALPCSCRPPVQQQHNSTAWHSRRGCLSRLIVHAAGEVVCAAGTTNTTGTTHLQHQQQECEQQQPCQGSLEQQQQQQQQEQQQQQPGVLLQSEAQVATVTSMEAANDAAATSSTDDEESSSTDDPASSDAAAAATREQQQPCYVYTTIWPQITEPTPVQVPPPDADMQPIRTWFNLPKYRPPRFLSFYASPPNSAYNFNSFLGHIDPNNGKYLAEGAGLDQFLSSYFNSLHLANRRMFLAECYQGQPFKVYQELDFPWTLDAALVLQLIPQVVDIVTQEVARVYADQVPAGVQLKPVLSMRTIYKVHLNFPGLNTLESKALEARRAVINRCRTELSGQPPLELLRDERLLQEQWQEAQATLVQLQDAVKQLQESGRPVPRHPQQFLEQHRQLLETAYSSSSSSSGSDSSSSQQQQQNSAAQSQQQQAQQQTPSQPAAEQVQQQDHQQQEQPQECLSLQEQQEQLDWESVVDFPHGSLRLLGSCKGPWMDKDPAWVTDKAYSRVEFVDGVWMRQPLDLASVVECSILLTEDELRVFSQTDQFLEAAYHAISHRDQMTAARRTKRTARKTLEQVQRLLQQPLQPPALEPKDSPTPQQREAAQAVKAQDRQERQQRRQEEEEQRAAREAEQARKKAEALAKIQAVKATSKPVSRPPPSLVRPLQRPSFPPVPPPS